jgi:hypothetical protein
VIATLLTVRAKVLLHADAWGDALTVSAQNRGLEHRLHALQNTSRRLGFRKPDGGKRLQNLSRFHDCYGPIANPWKHVGFHG